jgi:hypothetical protein
MDTAPLCSTIHVSHRQYSHLKNTARCHNKILSESVDSLCVTESVISFGSHATPVASPHGRVSSARAGLSLISLDTHMPHAVEHMCHEEDIQGAGKAGSLFRGERPEPANFSRERRRQGASGMGAGGVA